MNRFDYFLFFFNNSANYKRLFQRLIIIMKGRERFASDVATFQAVYAETQKVKNTPLQPCGFQEADL